MDQSSIRNKNPGGLKNEVRDLPFQKKGFNGMTRQNALKMGKIVQKFTSNGLKDFLNVFTWQDRKLLRGCFFVGNFLKSTLNNVSLSDNTNDLCQLYYS